MFHDVIVRLGGFHTSYNYLPVIGAHFAESGLSEIWIESGLYSQCVADQVMNGKNWNRAIRAHKLTFEAMWQVLFDSFRHCQVRQNKSSIAVMDGHAKTIVAKIITTLVLQMM